MRRKLSFQTLEPRLLLSADLAPVEGVLEVIGTNESDFAFISALQERLSVVLNGEAFDFALEEVKEIRVDLLGGNDTLRLDAGVALPAVQIDLGEGDNRFEADLLNPVGALSVVAGSGSDTMITHARWDGASVDDHPDFAWVPTYNPGAGDDSVHAELSTVESFVLGDGSVRVDARILAGDGNDAISFDLSQLPVGATRAPIIQIDLDGGAGNDLLKVTMPVASQGGDDEEPIDPAERRAPVSVRYDSRAGTDSFELIGGDAAESLQVIALNDPDLGRSFDLAASDIGTANPLVEAAVIAVTHVGVHTGAGNDLLQGRILLDADWNVELGDGDDVTDIETLIGDVFAEAQYRVDAGEGDNETSLRFGDGEHGARLPSGETSVRVEYRSGSGNDRVSFDWLAHLDRPLTVGLDVLTGAGDDLVMASWEQQYEFRSGKIAFTDYNFETGEGDDTVELRVAPGEGVDALGAEVKVASVEDPDAFGRVKVAFNWDSSGSLFGDTLVAGAEKLRLETGSGDDRVTVDDATGALRAVRFDVHTGAGDDEYQYVPVGRYEQYLEESVGEGLQWTVFDGGEGKDRFTLVASDRAEFVEIGGLVVDDIPDLVVRVTDVATQLVTLEASILGTESIDVDSAGGDDRVSLSDTDGPLTGIAFGIELGAGDDFIDVVQANPGPPDLPAATIDLAISAGDGADQVLIGLLLPAVQAANLMVNGGAGDDVIDVSAVMGVDPQPFLPDVTLAMAILAGEGDDRVDVRVALQEATGADSSAAVDIAVDLGAGQDAARMECTNNLKQLGLGLHVVDPDAGLDLNIATRGPAQRIYANVEAAEHGHTVETEVLGSGDTSAGTESIFYVLDISGSSGDDILDFAASGVFDEMQLAVDMGDGNDTVMFNPTELTIRKSAKWQIDTGAGEDDLVVETSGVRLAAQSRVEWLVDMGAGGDDVTHIRENWEIDAGADYRWAVALGEGDDTLKASVDGQTIGEGVSASYDFSGGDGDDRIDVSLADLALAAGAAFTVKIDAGDGNDLVAHELTHIVQQGGVPPPDDEKPAEFLVFTGAGDDTVADSFFDVFFDIHVGIDTGAGDDVVDFTAVMGVEPEPFVPVLDLDIRAGDGDDSVHAAMLLPAVQAAREAAHRTSVDLGSGDDTLQLDVHGTPPPDDQKPAEFRPAEFLIFGGAGDDTIADSFFDVYFDISVDLDSGAGNDVIDVSAVMGVEPQPFAPAPRLDLDLRSGDGDDSVQAALLLPAVQAAREAANRVNVDLGDGDDMLQMDVFGTPPPDDGEPGDFKPAEFNILGGAGDDTLETQFFDVFFDIDVEIDSGDGDDFINAVLLNPGPPNLPAGTIELDLITGAGNDRAALLLPAVQAAREAASKANVDLGDGDDTLQMDVLGIPPPDDTKPAEFRPAEFRVLGGAGNDTVRYRFFAIVDRTTPSASEFDARIGLFIDLGSGDDLAEIDIDTIGVAAGVTPCFDIGVHGGLGGDHVGIDARGVFDEFDLSVDLGADAAGRDIPTETLSLNFEEIRADYHAQSEHRYQADGDSDGATAHYSLGLRSDGELVQAVHRAETIGGLVSDHVDIEIGGNQAQTVGSNLTVAVGNRGGAEAGDAPAGVHDIRVIFDGLDNARMESAASFVGGAPADSLFVDLSADDDPVHAFFKSVSGLKNETEVVEHRAGAEIGDALMLEVGMSGVDAFALLTGDASDEIDIDLVYPSVPVPTLAFTTQGGNDSISGSFLGVAGALNLALDTGDGDDDVGLSYSEAAALVTGAGAGGGPHVKTFSGASAAEGDSFFAYDPQFTGGVRVAVGDVNGDGVADLVTGAGPGGGPHVKVFDGRTGAEIRSFFAYAASFAGGVNVAAGDVNNDGFADLITGADAGGGPHVRVFSGATGEELRSFFAYAPSFTGGVRVASGDVNDDGFADIITGAGAGGGPHVKVFDGISGAELRSFFAYDPSFIGGVFVAAGDVDGDGAADVVTGADAGGGPHVKVFGGATGAELRSFFAYTPSFTGGVRVAAGDVNGDGFADIVTGSGPGAGPHVKVFDGRTGAELRSFFAYDPGFLGGVYVAAGDIDSDAPGTFDLALDTGAGNDAVTLRLTTGASRDDAIAADLGTGADRFELKWHGALQEPSAEVQVLLELALGGADSLLPEVGDEVLLSFEHGDPDRPLVLGTVWNSQDVPQDQKRLLMTLGSFDGNLQATSELIGGSGRDEVTLSYAGTLQTAAAGQIDALVDLGDGDDAAVLDFSGLRTEGPQMLAPINVDLRGGAGRNTLSVTGTEGNDRFTLSERSVLLEGAANAAFAGFDFVQVHALGGNDQVTMTGLDPRIDWQIDGGAGRDRFFARFDDPDGNLTLVDFEIVKFKKKKR